MSRKLWACEVEMVRIEGYRSNHSELDGISLRDQPPLSVRLVAKRLPSCSEWLLLSLLYSASPNMVLSLTKSITNLEHDNASPKPSETIQAVDPIY